MRPPELKPMLRALAFALLPGACALPPGEPAPSAPHVDGRYYVDCEAPRPEVCPRHLDPVCGYSESGRRDHPNPCMACADSRVDGYRRGECPRTDPGPELDGAPGFPRLR